MKICTVVEKCLPLIPNPGEEPYGVHVCMCMHYTSNSATLEGPPSSISWWPTPRAPS